MLRSCARYLADRPIVRVRSRSAACSIRLGKHSCSCHIAFLMPVQFLFPLQGNMAESCQIAAVQGSHDLFGLLSNRLMVGYEYTARYNLGYSVPYDASFQRCDANLLGGPFHAISTSGRGTFRPIYELAYAHYASSKNLNMPYSLQIVSISPWGKLNACACG